MSLPATRSNLAFYRAALVTIAVVLPSLAVVFRWGAPQHGDPTLQRLLIGAAALVLTFASYRSAGVRKHLRQLTQLFMLGMAGWLLYYAAESGFEAPDFGGMVVYQFGFMMVFQRIRDLALNMTSWLLGIVAMLVFVTPEPVIHPAFLLGISAALAVVGAVVQWERGRLLTRLEEHQANLELRVEERTEELEREVEQRRNAEKAAMAASTAKSAFLTRMSHELRTPINAIVGYTELALEEIEDPTTAADLRNVLVASSQLLRLVDDVLDVARIESGQLELRPVVRPIGVVIEKAVVASGLPRDRFDVLGDLEIELALDVDRVIQILLALLHNAERFHPGGSVRIEVQQAPSTVTIDVADQGPGIKPADQERIFEAFTQGDESTRRTVDGLGLGLSIARELAQKMGGSLTVRSVLGEGATFQISLPRVAVPS